MVGEGNRGYTVRMPQAACRSEGGQLQGGQGDRTKTWAEIKEIWRSWREEWEGKRVNMSENI